MKTIIIFLNIRQQLESENAPKQDIAEVDAKINKLLRKLTKVRNTL